MHRLTTHLSNCAGSENRKPSETFQYFPPTDNEQNPVSKAGKKPFSVSKERQQPDTKRRAATIKSVSLLPSQVHLNGSCHFPRGCKFQPVASSQPRSSIVACLLHEEIA